MPVRQSEPAGHGVSPSESVERAALSTRGLGRSPSYIKGGWAGLMIPTPTACQCDQTEPARHGVSPWESAERVGKHACSASARGLGRSSSYIKGGWADLTIPTPTACQCDQTEPAGHGVSPSESVPMPHRGQGYGGVPRTTKGRRVGPNDTNRSRQGSPARASLTPSGRFQRGASSFEQGLG